MERIDSVYTILLILAVFSGIYLYYINSSSKETFQMKPFPAIPAIPAPAAIITAPKPIHIPRDVAPSGPSPPNARVTNKEANKKDVYQVVPTDPQDESYGSQDIQDNLRYPERMFGPGVVNSGNKALQESAIASKKIMDTAQPMQPFSPEMLQNGGVSDDGIAANDTDMNQNYSSF